MDVEVDGWVNNEWVVGWMEWVESRGGGMLDRTLRAGSARRTRQATQAAESRLLSGWILKLNRIGPKGGVLRVCVVMLIVPLRISIVLDDG